MWWVFNNIHEFLSLFSTLFINSIYKPVQESDTVIKLFFKKPECCKCILYLFFTIFWNIWDDDSSVKGFDFSFFEFSSESSSKLDLVLDSIFIKEEKICKSRFKNALFLF